MAGMAIKLEDLYNNAILQIEGLDCPDCAAKVEQAVKRMPGIIEADLGFNNAKLKFQYDPAMVGIPQVISKVNSLGYRARDAASQNHAGQNEQINVIRLEGLDCADCAAKLEKRIKAMPGVHTARVNYGAAKMDVSHDIPLEDVLVVIEKMGYKGRLEAELRNQDSPLPLWRNNKYALSTLMSGAILLLAVVGKIIGAPHLWTEGMFIAAILLGGFLPAKAGLSILINAHELDMNVLMSIAVIGAVALGQYEEGAAVVFLFSLGNALQAYSMDKTRNSIRKLMDLAPNEALVRRNGEEKTLPVEDIKFGDILVIRPGERLAMDGKVIKGISAVDEKAITGESIPADKNPGDKVYAGSINGYGAMEVEVTNLVQDNTIARIIAMVEDAQGQKAPSQQFVDRFSRYYTPAVILTAFLVAIVPPLFLQQPFKHWIYQALGMLLVACPCALVISTPVAIVSAIGTAARHGVLIKGGAYLEDMGQISAIAFDKTGTLTRGEPVLTDVIVLRGNEQEALSLAASLENRSEHPLAQAIVKYAINKEIQMMEMENFQAVAGLGAYADFLSNRYYIGNLRFFEEQQRELREEETQLLVNLQNEGKTVMLLGDDQNILALLAVADALRPESINHMGLLKKIGIKKVVMLTGDNERTARAIANKAGIKEFQAGLLPEDKLNVVKKLLDQGHKVAMVGDGVNDAPALAAATVGIAMGAAGTDTALETADIALMADDLSKVAYTIELGRRTLRIIKENITFSLLIKAGILLLVIPGWLTLWLAVVGDMGTSLLVTLNGMRLLRSKHL